MDIATGQAQDHPNMQSSTHPALANPTAIAESAMVQGGVAPATEQRLSQLAAGEAAAAAAMSSGMSADADRRGGYERDIAPLGAYGDALALPVLPDNAVPPAGSDLYGNQGDEPPAPLPS